MWRERFGFDMPHLERAKLYLSELDSWLSNARMGHNLSHYHKTFPEFTLRVPDAEDVMARHEEWTRGEIRTDNNHAGYYELYYHQTCLARIHYVSFDDHKKSMVAPNCEPRGAGRFYFYEADSINYAVQKYMSYLEREDHSTTLSIRGQGKASNEARSRWGHYMKIPVLRPGELNPDFRQGSLTEPFKVTTPLLTSPEIQSKMLVAFFWGGTVDPSRSGQRRCPASGRIPCLCRHG